jgi:hypothetical protein
MTARVGACVWGLLHKMFFGSQTMEMVARPLFWLACVHHIAESSRLKE